jgi:hypothetical protein
MEFDINCKKSCGFVSYYSFLLSMRQWTAVGFYYAILHAAVTAKHSQFHGSPFALLHAPDDLRLTYGTYLLYRVSVEP